MVDVAISFGAVNRSRIIDEMREVLHLENEIIQLSYPFEAFSFVKLKPNNTGIQKINSIPPLFTIIFNFYV